MEKEILKVNDVNSKIKTKLQLYNILSKKYYLPKLSSKAITKRYLMKYTENPIPVYTICREGMIGHNFRINKYDGLVLLEKLEQLLEAKRMKSTGMDLLTVPDKEWMMNAILNLDPSDPYGLLDPAKNFRPSFEIEVNSE